MAASAPGLFSPTLPRQAIHTFCWTPKPTTSTTACHRRRRRISGTNYTTISARASAAAAVARGLDADDFRHPLDKQNTFLLRAIPGLNDMGKALLGPVSEQVMVLQNIGSSVLVSENQCVWNGMDANCDGVRAENWRREQGHTHWTGIGIAKLNWKHIPRPHHMTERSS